jgi:hypothetical protein
MRQISFLTLVALAVSACGAPPASPTAAAPPTVEQPLETQAPPAGNEADVAVASQMANLLYDLEAVRDYYEDGTTAMALVAPEASTTSRLPWGGARLAAPPERPLVQIQNVPSEFLAPLPPSGAIAAPAGACPAAAEPSVTFQTAAGDPVTPELIAEENLSTIPMEMVTVPQDAPESLVAAINDLVPMGDPRLATAEGWNELLWDPLRDLQEPAESLMDYQLWNASPDIEDQVEDLYLERLTAAGAPPIVLDAFEESRSTAWYASSAPTPDDALALMDIEAVMTGSVEGTVHEQRPFHIPGAGREPEFGPQTGEGTVTWDHPTLGPLHFEVSILLDQFDEQGRAIGGTVVGVDAERGYEIRFRFMPDGSKDGELLRDGEVIGTMTMTTDAERFENYIDLETQEAIPLP